MVFSSLTFLFVFFPILIFLYFLADDRYKNFILFIASLIFYAWGEPVYILLMIFSTIFDYVHGLLVEKSIINNNKKKAKMIVVSSVVINLAILCFFKYSDFIISNINIITGLNLKLLNLPLPIGISFYTFQTMSYTIDVYRGKAKAQKNIIDFGMYVSLFPQLVAGPIVRYQTIAEQINKRIHSIDKFTYGLSRFIIGLSKKIILANPLGLIADEVFACSVDGLTTGNAWIGIIAYTLQIYFDFSGYSDMAIGLGKMFGFDFLENFNYPYISKSVSEFWRRWHISLGSWFRDYVYIPLGGNRVSKSKQFRNLFIVWFLTGVWHGSSWNFIIWGLYYGVLIALEKILLHKFLNKIHNSIKHLYLIVIVMIGWVFFRAETLSYAIEYIKVLCNFNNILYDSRTILYLKDYLATIIISMIFATPIYKLVEKQMINIKDKMWFVVMKSLILTVLLIVIIILLVNSTYNPFLYFRF